MENRQPTIEGDLALVPLGRDAKHGYAKLYHSDYNVLMARGISGNWTLSNGYVVVTVPGSLTATGPLAGQFSPKRGPTGGDNHLQSKPRQEYVARLLMGANDQEIRYADNDTTNLIRENLSAHERELGTSDANKSFPYLGVPGSFGAAMSSLSHRFLDRGGHYDHPDRRSFKIIYNPFAIDKAKQRDRARIEADPVLKAEHDKAEATKTRLIELEQKRLEEAKANPKALRYGLLGKLKDQN